MDIERKRGDTYGDVFVLKSKKTKAPIDITGYSFLLTVDPNKAPTDNTTNVFQLTGEIIDATGGKVSFAPSAMQADKIGSYYYDVQMIDSSGKKRTIADGKYKFVQDITKD